MLTTKKPTVLCENCGLNPAISFSWFKKENKWKFCCQCTADTEDYYIPFKDCSSWHEWVDWLAHMSEKGWFDAKDFCEMIHRFRDAGALVSL